MNQNLVDEVTKRFAEAKATGSAPVSKPKKKKKKTGREAFEYVPPKVELKDNQKWYSDVFGELPKGCVDIPMTFFSEEDWHKDIVGFIPEETNYLVQHDVFYYVVDALENNKRCLIVGKPGTGKTAGLKYLCGLVKRPYVRINGMAGLDPTDMVGGLQAKEGSTYYALGDAGLAAKYGAVLALDEPFKNNASVNMCFMNLAEKGDAAKLLLYGHPEADKRHLKPHPLHRLMLCDNVRGSGDNLAQYASTEIQDSAFLNRMTYNLYLPYLYPVQEEKLLKDMYPVLIDEEVKKMVGMAGLMRDAWDTEQVQYPYSFRNIEEWADCYLTTGNIVEAFKKTYPYEGEPDKTLEVINNLWRDVGFPMALASSYVPF